MRSKASFSKVSTAIIKEDFRRFWIIPVLAFLDYFLCNVFYIIMNIKNLPDPTDEASEYIASFIENFLTGSNAASISIMIWVPVLSVLLVFRYLHNSGHTVSVHSQPFTRQTLLNSHTISCILFIVIPVVLTGLILMLIAHPAYVSSYNDDGTRVMENIFTRLNILRWMWESVMTSVFVLMIAIGAGMITGTVFHHAIAALGFNFVLPICTAILTLYGQTYLFGYAAPEWLRLLCVHMTPVFNAFESGYMNAWENVLYIVLTALLYLAASFLYRKRKLERATEGIVFHTFNVIITLIFGYLGMTAFGLVFYGIFEYSNAAAAFGYITGGLLGMLVVRMIIMKTVRIFNRRTFILIGAYTCAALAFFAVLVFDLIGYETRICDRSDSVSIECEVISNTYESQEVKDLVRELHQMIIDNKDICIENERATDEYEESSYICITYYKGDGDDDTAKMLEKRRYSVPTYLLFQSPEFRSLLDADEVTDKLAGYVPESGELQYIQAYSGSYYTSSAYGQDDAFTVIEGSEKMDGLIAAIKKDIKDRSAEDYIHAYNTSTVAEIDFHYLPKKAGVVPMHSETSGTEEFAVNEVNEDVTGSVIMASDMEGASAEYLDQGFYAMDIDRSFRNTIQWLIDNGYGYLIDYDDTYYKTAVICEVTDGQTAEELTFEINKTENGLDLGRGFTVVTDPVMIHDLYSHTVSHMIFGRQSELTSSEDGVYKALFLREYNDHMEIDYEAYIEKQYIDGVQ